jgi:hypothetical protein
MMMIVQLKKQDIMHKKMNLDNFIMIHNCLGLRISM